MQLQHLKHRHWVMIGLLTGLIAGGVRAYYAAQAEPEGPYSGIKENVLEERLAMKNPITNTFPYFESLEVRPFGNRQILVGTYTTKLARRQTPGDLKSPIIEIYDTKMLVMLPDTGVFVASTPQFAPLTAKPIEVEVRLKVGMEKEAAEALSGRGFTQTAAPSETVRIGKILPSAALDLIRVRGVESVQPSSSADTPAGFLAKAKAKYPELKIDFRYAWWRLASVQFTMCLLIGVLGIGGVWPFVVNLMAFGQLRQPREEKATIDLSKVKSGTAEIKPQVSAADQAALEAHVRELEAELHSASAAGPAAAAPQPAEPEIRKLDAEPLEPEVAQDQPSRDYAGEFYPTEAHVPRRNE